MNTAEMSIDNAQKMNFETTCALNSEFNIALIDELKTEYTKLGKKWHGFLLDVGQSDGSTELFSYIESKETSELYKACTFRLCVKHKD